MRNILFYGDSNSWGNIANSFDPNLLLHQRYEYGVRWTSIVQTLLGANYHIIEEGLNGRNTSFDEIDSTRPSRNGLATLPGILDAHYPLDIVVFMLGTNDLKIEFNASLARIKEGMRQLIRTVKDSSFGRNATAPHVMLIAPAPILKMESELFSLYLDDASVEKSHQLAEQYQQLAHEENCSFLDINPIVKVSLADGIHIDEDSQVHLARAVTEKIKEIRCSL
jgi:lysophospholipase L1-like esterase